MPKGGSLGLNNIVALCHRGERNRAVRTLSILSRMSMAAWLGILGIGVQAALPLFLAFAIASADRVGIADGALSAIHPDHGDQAPAHPHHPPTQHINCVLCQGHHAAGPVTLPAAIVLAAPSDERGAHAPGATTVQYVRGSPASYTSRAPPLTV
jgi:hypothetical protein